MISVGDRLGGRYFVTGRPASADPSECFEVRDPQSRVFQGAHLHPEAVPPAALELARAELSAVPSGPRLAPPEELHANPAGVPVGLWSSPWPPPLAQRLRESAGLRESVPVARALLEHFSALAEALAPVHAKGVCHGAVALSLVRCAGEDTGCVLYGFGVEPCRRSGPRPHPKDDLRALVRALHDALKAAQVELPAGPSLTKWNVLQHCARGGEHPAFASSEELASHLRELSAELAAPTTTTRTTPARGASPLRGAASEPRRFTLGRRPVVLLVAGLVLVLLAVAVTNVLQENSTAQTGVHSGGVSGGPRVVSCGEEPIASPTALDLAAPATWVDGACTEDQQTLVLAAQVGAQLLAGRRTSARGGRFSGGLGVVGNNVSEVSSILPQGGRVSLAWRSATGVPFGYATLTPGPTAMALPADGWSGAPLRGVHLLRADEREYWLASTLELPGGVRKALVFQARAGDGASLRGYLVGDGAVVAVLPGDPAVLLLQVRDSSGASLQVVRVPLAVLPVVTAAVVSGEAGVSADAAVADGGAPGGSAWPWVQVPPAALRRNGRWALEGSVAPGVVPRGVTSAGGGAQFLVTVGAPTREGCTLPECVGEGPVTLLEFPTEGEVGAVMLAGQGRGEDLAPSAEGLLLLVQDGARLVRTLRPTGTLARAVLMVRGARPTRFVRCGQESWLAFGVSPPPRLAALPVPCVSRGRGGE